MHTCFRFEPPPAEVFIRNTSGQLKKFNRAAVRSSPAIIGCPARTLSTADYPVGVTFANAGTLGTAPGKRDELVAHLTQRSDTLREIGCLAYEVGINDDDADTVFVVELWESEEAHTASLALPEVQASIAAARPLLSGTFGGFRFTVVGSPLRDSNG
jgi:quinol monooxygenase YgiN